MRIKSIFILLITISVSWNSYAQVNPWTEVYQRDYSVNNIYRVLKLDKYTSKEILMNKANNQALNVSFPLPNGKNEVFKLEASQLLAPPLAKKYPQIKTYNGTARSGHTIKLDFNGSAFHATIRTEKGLIYIDPNDQKKPTSYKSYYVKDFKKLKQKPSFDEIPFQNPSAPISLQKQLRNVANQNVSKQSAGGITRKYRIAVTADSDYSSFHGETTESVLSAIVTTINRVNSVYENDLSITFEIVAQNDELIFLDSSTDPFEGVSMNQILRKNKEVIEGIIDIDDYDIGHLFTVSTGGFVEELGIVCSSIKAFGTTGIRQPVGDPFDIDFVAHEIGHQFGARHTFNGTQNSCGEAGQRSASTAFEPGSGTTIMAYAGICGSDNLQENSDPFFHSNSLEEITSFVTIGNGSSCAVLTENGNTPPEITIDQTQYTIPINTPFKLTASARDNEGDELTYSWEQTDLGPGGSPENPVGNAPLFRLFNPTGSPTRTFPRLANILDNSNSFGETLPSTTRPLTFKLSVRDNHVNGGGFSAEELNINSTSNAGPFKLTSQNSEEITLTGGLTQEITWDVANTNIAPVNVSQVRIKLSTDGGLNFDHVLIESTENDGVALVQLPEVQTNSARIMIEAIDHIFFDINDANFNIIQAATPDFTLRINPIPILACSQEDAIVEVSLDAVGGFNSTVSLSITNLTSPLVASFSSNTITSGQTSTLTIANIDQVENLTSQFNIIASSESSESKTTVIPLSVINNSQVIVETRQPAINGINIDINPFFEWATVNNANSYIFQLSLNENFDNLIFENTEIISPEVSLPFNLEENTTYFWRVASSNNCGNSEFTTARFRTIEFNRSRFLPIDETPIEIPNSGLSTTTSIISINEDLLIDDLNVEGLNITHSWISDLIIILESPNGTRATLISNICNSENNILTNFDDEAMESTLPCPPVSNEVFRPETPLSIFNGENAKGNWILEIRDVANQDGGFFNRWELNIGTVERDINLIATANSQNDITLNWTLLNNLEGITGFEISTKAETDSGFSKLIEVSNTTTTFTVTDLIPFTKYEYLIRGIIGTEFSDYSNTAKVTTLPPIPPTPSNLSASFLSAVSIRVNWSDDSRFEAGYILEVSTNDSDWRVEETLMADQTEYIFRNAILGESYFFRVQAFNSVGSSEYSAIASLILANIEESVSEEITVYPNPGKNTIYLKTSSNSIPDQVLISDLSGKTFGLKPVLNSSNNIYELDTSPLNKGLYVITFINQNKRKSIRWVKQ